MLLVVLHEAIEKGDFARVQEYIHGMQSKVVGGQLFLGSPSPLYRAFIFLQHPIHPSIQPNLSLNDAIAERLNILFALLDSREVKRQYWLLVKGKESHSELTMLQYVLFQANTLFDSAQHAYALGYLRLANRMLTRLCPDAGMKLYFPVNLDYREQVNEAYTETIIPETGLFAGHAVTLLDITATLGWHKAIELVAQYLTSSAAATNSGLKLMHKVLSKDVAPKNAPLPTHDTRDFSKLYMNHPQSRYAAQASASSSSQSMPDSRAVCTDMMSSSTSANVLKFRFLNQIQVFKCKKLKASKLPGTWQQQRQQSVEKSVSQLEESLAKGSPLRLRRGL